jgi:hypothetical protein
MLKLTFYSLIASGLTIALGFVVGTFVPTVLPEAGSSGDPVAKSDLKVITVDAAARAQEEAKKRLERQRAKEREKPLLQFVAESRQAGQWISWLPWIFLPIVVRQRRYEVIATALLLPAVLALLQILLPLEFVLCALALFLSTFLVNRYLRTQADYVPSKG